jgi:biopolymer transport protein ExbD
LHSRLVFTPGVPIRLAEADDLPGVIGHILVVAVDANGQYYFENQLTHEHLLRARLSEKVSAAHEPVTLVIEADEGVSWNNLQKLGALARKAGVKDAVLATRPSLSGSKRSASLPEP